MTATALVTGATGGLGPAVAAKLVQDGWRVVAPVRGEAEQVVPGVRAVQADVTDPTDVAGAVAAAAADPSAPLRAVVNLVGGFAAGGRIHETPIEAFEAQLRINLRPAYLVTAAALPHVIAAGGGGIVCVSSRAALAPWPGAAGYITAKAAVLAFAGAVAVEYRKQNVRCNTIVPSVIDTPANRRDMPDADFSRWVKPAEIAPAILFLASDASAPTTGATVPVYGQA